MGIAVSNWRLARAVASLGQIGVVSGTVIDTVLVRRLQDGDPGGHVRRAMTHFPIPGVAASVLERFFLPEGARGSAPYALLPMYQQVVTAAREQLAMLAAFTEVRLAKEGHDGLVGINLLTKVQMPNLALLYGALLAGVDFVLMGAGIPRDIPAALDALALHRPAEIRLDLEQASAGRVELLRLDPARHWSALPAPLARPRFLPIVGSHSLAIMLARKTPGIDGFVVEGPTAGGHNTPPREKGVFDENGEPVYGPRDLADLEKIRELGLPFWVAGGGGSPAALTAARAAGAAGVQVGTLFAYCEESGLDERIRGSVLASAARGEVRVRTDSRASPTGFPFKVVSWPQAPGADAPRKRICDLGYLRVAYEKPEGGVGYRCASEPERDYLAKGGDAAELDGRRCLCNSLLATIGLAQVREEGLEPPLLTSGDDAAHLGDFLAGRTRYAAADVVRWLLGGSRVAANGAAAAHA
ncbi:MAG: nitronate monooxygenase [Candidatus Eisenbacteria bacterium]|nr:nitronate monooxygenase [Candidatus Eisenbacteria bacterium]